jgi:hypothetical protein
MSSVKCFFDGVAFPRSAILIEIDGGINWSAREVSRRGKLRGSGDCSEVSLESGGDIMKVIEDASMGVGGGMVGRTGDSSWVAGSIMGSSTRRAARDFMPLQMW